jgi:hypothetical protein
VGFVGLFLTAYKKIACQASWFSGFSGFVTKRTRKDCRPEIAKKKLAIGNKPTKPTKPTVRSRAPGLSIHLETLCLIISMNTKKSPWTQLLRGSNVSCKEEHGMTLSWKARALAAEKKLPKPKKKAGAEEPALSMHTSGSDELDGLIDPCVTEGEMV